MSLPSLSEDLIVEILLKLPVRSLLRFKCVCKSWSSLISDYEFAKSHFDIAATPSHRLFLVEFSELDSKLDATDIEGPLDHDSARVAFNIPLLSPPTLKYDMTTDFMGSCRGFILLITKCLDTEFLIWNPSTGFHKRIVHKLNNIMRNIHYCGIGYDSSTDDYVVVIVAFSPRSSGGCGWKYTKLHCFSSRTNSWSCVELTCRANSLSYPSFNHGVFLNGTIHWLGGSYTRYNPIIAFDVMERRLFEIPLPRGLDYGPYRPYDLRVMGECLCLCFHGSMAELPEMWTMKEYKVQSSWTRSFVLSSSYHNDFFFNFVPICFTKNGDVLGSDCNATLARLNDKGEVLEQYTHWRETHSKIWSGLHHFGMYRESLLSLPGEFEEASELTCRMHYE